MDLHFDPVSAGIIATVCTTLGLALAKTYDWLMGRQRIRIEADDHARDGLTRGQALLFQHFETHLQHMQKSVDASFEREREARHKVSGLAQQIISVKAQADHCERERDRDKASAAQQARYNQDLQNTLLAHIGQLDGMLKAQNLNVPELRLPTGGAAADRSQPGEGI